MTSLQQMQGPYDAMQKPFADTQPTRKGKQENAGLMSGTNPGSSNTTRFKTECPWSNASNTAADVDSKAEAITFSETMNIAVPLDSTEASFGNRSPT